MAFWVPTQEHPCGNLPVSTRVNPRPPHPTPRLSAGCKASKRRVRAKGQRTCSSDRVTSHHTGTQRCPPVVKPRVLLPRGLRKMWLSTQQSKQVCHFLACALITCSKDTQHGLLRKFSRFSSRSMGACYHCHRDRLCLPRTSRSWSGTRGPTHSLPPSCTSPLP